MDQNFNTQPNEEQSPATPSAPQESTPPAQQFSYNQQNDTSYGYYYNQPPKAEPNGYAIASLILGIVSLILCCCSCISIVTSILAIVFAVLSRQGQPMRGNAMGGMICGIVGLAATLLCTGFFLLIIAETNAEDMDDFFNGYMGDEYYYDYNEESGVNGDYFIGE